MQYLPAGAVPSGTLLLRLVTTDGRHDLKYDTGSSGRILYESFTAAGASLGSVFYGSSLNGKRMRLSLQLQQAGSNTDVTFGQYEVAAPSGSTFNATITGATVGVATQVQVNPSRVDLGATVIGHVTVESAITDLFAVSAAVLNGYTAETASARMIRLAGENDTLLVGLGGGEWSQPLGPQKSLTLADLIAEAAAADGGALFEPRDGDWLQYRALAGHCSQTPTLTVTYTDNLLLPFEPTDDDQQTANRVTVARAGGASVTAELTTGPLSTQAPPAGVGIYETSATLSLATDDHAELQAWWRLAAGTVDEARWPTIGVNLAHPTFLADTTLTSAVLDTDIGDLLEVDDLPPWLPPVTVSQLVRGYTERIKPQEHVIEFTCAPARPYRVARYAAATDRYSGEGTVTTNVLSTTGTTVLVDTPTDVEWSHADGDFDIVINGEQMTVTAVTGTATTQTFTVVRSVNGVARIHANGSAVQLADPVLYGVGT